MATFTLTGNINQLTGLDSTRVTMLEIRPTFPIADPATDITYEIVTRVPIVAGAFTVTLPAGASPSGYGFVITAPQVGMRWYVPEQAASAAVDLSSFTDVVPAIDPFITQADIDAVLAHSVLDATRGTVDPRSYGAVFNGVADDASAIQSALATGLDVVIAPLPGGAAINVKVGATLLMASTSQGQKLITINATLKPSFLGDVVKVNGSYQHAAVSISGASQPGAGDFSEVAGVRIGDSTTGYPFNASVAGTRVLNFKGNGILWDNGPMVDFTQVYISDVTYDGIRAGNVNIDANHGLFIGCHVIRAARYGYHIKRDSTVSEPLLDSRFNQFVQAKAYDCGVQNGVNVTTSGGNFRIESNSNFGTIFSELGIVTLTAESYGNHLEMQPFNSVSPIAEDVYGHNDLGNGNRLEGMSYFERYETIKARFHRVEWNARFSGRRYIEQTGANTFLDKIVDSSAVAYIDYDKDTGFDRIDRFNGQLGLPGDNADRAILADTETGILTVPAATTVAAGATYTSGTLIGSKSQYSNGFATMFAGSTDLLVSVQITAAFNAVVTVRNLSGASIDISSKMIRWTVLAYRN